MQKIFNAELMIEDINNVMRRSGTTPDEDVSDLQDIRDRWSRKLVDLCTESSVEEHKQNYVVKMVFTLQEELESGVDTKEVEFMKVIGKNSKAVKNLEDHDGSLMVLLASVFLNEFIFTDLVDRIEKSIMASYVRKKLEDTQDSDNGGEGTVFYDVDKKGVVC